MPSAPKPNRYNVSGSSEAQYADAGGLVLVNRPGIKDLEELQRAEEQALAEAYRKLFEEVRTDTPLTSDLLLHIHRTVFGDLFEWGGRWRTVNIEKPGAIWPSAQFLSESMSGFERDVLRKHRAAGLAADAMFCGALAEIQGEFLAIHPFREGNARTIKLATDVLSAQTGRPLLRYDKTADGAESYIAAASAALHQKNYKPLTAIIRAALEEGRRQTT